MSAALELTTDRLLLRQFEEADFAAYHTLCSDPEVMRFLGGVLSEEDAWRQMAYFRGHWDLRGYGMYAVEERDTGELVGRVGYLHPAGYPGFEVAWTLRRSAWGKGFAAEAGSAVMDQALGAMEVERAISLIDPDNHRSINVAERLGERLFGETVMHGSRILIYSISSDEWLQLREQE